MPTLAAETNNDKWGVLKDVMSGDLEEWRQIIAQLETRKLLSTDQRDILEIDMALGTFMIYEAVLSHYLELMEDFDKVDDGGTETSDT